MVTLIILRGSSEVSRTALFKIGLVLVTTVQSIHGMYPQNPGPIGSALTCTTNINVSIMEVPSPHQEIIINLSSDFKYLQTSMILDSCYNYNIFRGNKFITRKVLNGSQLETEVSMILSHTSVEGTHAYTINIDNEIINFTDVINTSLKCGKFQGFRVKAVGATLCTISEQEEGHQDSIWEMSRPVSLHEEKHTESEIRSKLSNDEDDVDKVAVNTIRELHQWVNGAYVMAICFVFTVYGLFLLAKMCQSGGVIHEILHAREKTASLDPSDVP